MSEAGEVVEKEEALVGSLDGKRLADGGVDLYQDLQGMQKWSGERRVGAESRREQGRMKNRQNVIDKV